MMRHKRSLSLISLSMGGLVLLITTAILLLKPKEYKIIVCWGDSLTAPAFSSENVISKIYKLIKGPRDWPAFLQKDLGFDYNVINAAVGGENTLGIMLRQGSLPLYAGNDMVFDAHAGMITHIACKHDSLFERALGG